MKRSSVIAGLALVAIIVSGASVAQASPVYDISNDFSTATNPNGVWTYGYSTTLGGSLTAYDQSGTYDSVIQYWSSSSFGAGSLNPPADYNNPTGSQFTTCGSCSPLPANTAAFHPGPQNQFSVYQFTSPVTGSFNLSATFMAFDQGQPSVYILDNGTTIFSSLNLSRNTPVSFSDTLALTVLDTIDFVVGVGSDNSYLYDSTAINATLTTSATPLPSTWLMLLSGFVGLGYFAYRGTKKNAAALAAA